MELLLKRKIRTEKSTIGELYIDGRFFCYTLEDKDRGLKQSDLLPVIVAKKIFAVTAIPSGRYKVDITYSNRFKRDMPLLMDVKGYAGVRIHPGNKSEDTEGCILVGMAKYTDLIGESRPAFDALMKVLQASKEQAYITIE